LPPAGQDLLLISWKSLQKKQALEMKLLKNGILSRCLAPNFLLKNMLNPGGNPTALKFSEMKKK
jgi:hypothetical protein